MSNEEYDSAAADDQDDYSFDDGADLDIAPPTEKKDDWSDEDEPGDENVDGEADANHSEFVSSTTSENSILVIVVDRLKRLTSEKMTSFEYTECISIRAEQIAHNGGCMVDITGLSNPIEMAERELLMRKCPLILRRHVGHAMYNGKLHPFVEDWSPNEMQFPRNIGHEVGGGG